MTRPDTICPVKSTDDISIYLTEKHHLPENWQGYSFSCAEEMAPEGTMRVVGCVVYALRSGKHKGQPNWKKMVPGTKHTVWLIRSEFDAWLVEREKRTDTCHKCRGTGQEFYGVSVEGGRMTKPCTRCNATGKAPA